MDISDDEALFSAPLVVEQKKLRRIQRGYSELAAALPSEDSPAPSKPQLYSPKEPCEVSASDQDSDQEQQCKQDTADNVTTSADGALHSFGKNL